MKYIYNIPFFLVSCAVVLAISGCTGSSKDNLYAHQYSEQLKKKVAINLQQENVESKWVEKQFDAVMNHFKAPDVVDRAKEIFSPKLYFNDTWHTHTGASELGEYLKRTGDRVHAIEVLVQDVAINQTNAYVRWTMSFTVDEGDKPIESVGMTHLQFDENKKIITYQDYWDGIEGFYRTLPIIGGALSAIRKKMG